MGFWDILLLFAVGCTAGIVNVMAGGGSLLTMPILVMLGLDGPVANGTNRVAILLQNITAVGGFFRRGFSDFKLSLTLTLCALPGTVLGAWLGTKLGGIWFNRVLAAVMIAVLILMVRKNRNDYTKTETVEQVSKKRLIWAHILMLGAGFYGGFIQAGVGFILMAILNRVLKLDLVRVNMHKVFIVGTYTLLALIIFAIQGKVFWITGLLLAVGNITGGWIGTNLSIEKGERIIKIIFNIALVAMAIKLVFFSSS